MTSRPDRSAFERSPAHSRAVTVYQGAIGTPAVLVGATMYLHRGFDPAAHYDHYEVLAGLEDVDGGAIRIGDDGRTTNGGGPTTSTLSS